MIAPEPPAGSEHYREGWRHGYEQAAIDRERAADAVRPGAASTWREVRAKRPPREDRVAFLRAHLDEVVRAQVPEAREAKSSHSVYVRVRDVLRAGLRTEEITDTVALDWEPCGDGEERLVGVEVLDARGAEIDGLDVVTGRAHGTAPDAGQASPTIAERARAMGIKPSVDASEQIAALTGQPLSPPDIAERAAKLGAAVGQERADQLATGLMALADDMRSMAGQWPDNAAARNAYGVAEMRARNLVAADRETENHFRPEPSGDTPEEKR